MKSERLTLVSRICLENMPSPLIPFKGVLLSSVPAPLVKTQSQVLQCLPPVLLLQVSAPFPDQSGQLSAGILPSSLHFKFHRNRGTMSHLTVLHYTTVF